MKSPLSILTGAKSFGDPWIGHPALNRLGLHPFRVWASDRAAGLRQRTSAHPSVAAELARFRRDGVLVLPEFFEPPLFDEVRAESERRMAVLEAASTPPPAKKRGFGPKLPFEGGFDRYDGGTLNRFATIDPVHTPATFAALSDARLIRLCEATSGRRFSRSKLLLYQTRHGDERRNPDIQKQIHRDTFHRAVKLWLYLDDVGVEHGPFCYAVGSHCASIARLRWEHRRAVAVTSNPRADRGGSFRISERELAALGYGLRAFPVARNTLIIADVRGFHRRGDAPPGAQRLAIYGNFRPLPFLPFIH